MRKTLILITLIFSLSWAFEGGGFETIPFGVSKEKVIEEVFKMGITPENRIRSGLVIIPIYQFRDLPVEVAFRFNRNGKFFSYELRTGKVEKDRFYKVVEAARYLSEQVADQFGKPAHKNYFRLEELEGRRYAQYWVWNDSEIDVATYIRSSDARYFTQATITHKRLARER